MKKLFITVLIVSVFCVAHTAEAKLRCQVKCNTKGDCEVQCSYETTFKESKALMSPSELEKLERNFEKSVKELQVK